MTFTERTKDIPLALVKQGWGLCPSNEVTTAWSDGVSPLCRWQYVTRCGVLLARPLRVIEYSVSSDWPITAYAHDGWADGLAPTAEMVNVWPLWWLRDHCGEMKVCSVRLNADLDIETADYWIGDRLVFHSDIPEWGLWRGPVLPPARTA